MVTYKKTKTNRATGKKTTTKGTTTPVSRSNFNSNSGKMRRTSKPISSGKMRETATPISRSNYRNTTRPTVSEQIAPTIRSKSKKKKTY